MPKTMNRVRPWSGCGLGTVKAGSRRENPAQDHEEPARTVTDRSTKMYFSAPVSISVKTFNQLNMYRFICRNVLND